MQIIQLNQGYTTIVDDADFEVVKQYKWYVAKNSTTPYAIAEIPCTECGHKKTTGLHRFLLKPKAKEKIDHIDGNGLNNQRSNLRIATMSQNIANSRLRKDNTSGYKGVTWFSGSKHPNGAWKRKPGWSVRVSLNGKRIQVGYYQDKEDAAKAYNDAAIKYHGEFAKLNKL